MSLASITGVFQGATVSNGDLTIPSGTIISFSPSSTTNPGGYELVFGLLESLHRKIGTNYSNVTSSVANQLVSNGSVIRRNYTFGVNLEFGNEEIASLDVAPTGV